MCFYHQQTRPVPPIEGSKGLVVLLLLIPAIIIMTSCAGVSQAATGSTQSSPSAPQPAINVSPASGTVTAGGSVQFSAAFTSSKSGNITWSATRARFLKVECSVRRRWIPKK
jgi:hypothetical protein